MDFNTLPNLFIIGASKSGTTSLFEIIAQHPDTYASKKKETRFFSNDDRFNEGIDWYVKSNFPDASKFDVRYEATPAYLTWSEKVAPRIKALYRNHYVKFIAIFRDPVKRAYSHYWHRVRQGDEDPNRISFAEAIHTESKRIKDIYQWLEYEGNGLFGYYRAGCYATRLRPYLDTFSRENFFFMLQEDLYTNFDANIKKLLRFLNIDVTHSLNTLASNKSVLPRDQRVYDLFVKVKKTRIKQSLKLLIPPAMRRWVRNDAIMKPFHYPPMDSDIKAELYMLYEDEIKQLEEIIERDLSHWTYTEN